MRWMLNLDGGPRRVNHAAVAIGDKVYSFGGYSANEALDNQGDFIDVHVLNTFSYRWQRLPVFPPDTTAKETKTKQRSVTVSGADDLGTSDGPSTSRQASAAAVRRRARSLSDLHPLALIRATNPPLEEDGNFRNVQQHHQANSTAQLAAASPTFIANLGRRQSFVDGALRCLAQRAEARHQQQMQQNGRHTVRDRVIVEEDAETDEQQQRRQENQQLRQLFQRIDHDLAEILSDGSDEDYVEDGEEVDSLISEDMDSEDTDDEYMDTDGDDEASDADMVELGPIEIDEEDDYDSPVTDLVLLARLHQHPEIPFKRYGHTVVAYKNLVYLWGGRNDKLGCNQTLHCYDPVENRWSVVHTEGQCPPARDGHTAVVEGDHMYIFGGFEEKEHRFSQETYAFHFPSKTWRKLRTQGESPQYRDFHAACILNGRMFVFGGRSDEMGQLHTSHDVYCDKLHYLDLKTEQWHQPTLKTPVAPCGRRSHTMWTYKGAMYLFGGFQSNRNVHFNDLWRFEPDSNTWTLVKPSGQGPSPRRRQCTVVVGHRVFLFGGTMPSTGKRNTLSDLGDLYVLDFDPSLASLCCQSILKHGLQRNAEHLLPKILSRELYYMCTPNQITKSHMPLSDSMTRG